MRHSNFELYINSTNVRISKNVKFFGKILTAWQWLYPRGIENFIRKKFFTPNPKPLTETQSNWIKKATTIQIESRGRKIQLWKIGTGPTILFIHGWSGRGVQFQNFFQPALDAGFSVLFFDAPAHGFSEGDMTNYLEVTESVNNILNHEIGKDITGIVSHSLGSAAIINHLSNSDHSASLVLISPALRLMELLFTNLQIHGVPKKTYVKLLNEVEEKFQIQLATRNPIDLIYGIRNSMLIIHDNSDKTTPVGPSFQVAEELDNVEFMGTEGYGHNKVLAQQFVIEKALKFIVSHQSEMVNDNFAKV